MRFNTLSPLKQRFLASGICITALLLVIYVSFIPWVSVAVPLFASLAFGTAVNEYYELSKNKGHHPPSKIGVGFTALYIFALYFCVNTPYYDLLPLITLTITLATFFISYFSMGKNSLTNLAVALFGIFYLAVPLGCTLQINYNFFPDQTQDGRWWLFYLLFLTYITDSGALFFGKAFGRNRLAPAISPQKTWEGATGGFFTALLSSVTFAALSGRKDFGIPMHLELWESLFLGAAISILAQVGDLAESLLKRDAGVKDSSNIPGLGGVLDVVDSLVFTAPFLFLYLRYQYP